MDKHFPKSNKLQQIFNRNTVSYCCTGNLSCIIRSHNKSVINGKKPTNVNSNCRNKSVYPLDGNCQQNDVIYKCITSTSVNPDKKYLGTVGEFKKQYCSHNKSLRHHCYANETTLSKYVWDKYKINTMRYLP